MRVFCKECNITLSEDLAELSDLSLLNEGDQMDFIPVGYIFTSDGEFFTRTENKLILNIDNLLNSDNHPDRMRLGGCCGLDGTNGLNTVCTNGHEIGTLISDCFIPHCIILEPNKVGLK